MPDIASLPQSAIVGRQCSGNRFCLRAVIISLALFNINIVETALASGVRQTTEAVPFNIHPLCLRNLIGAMDSSRPDVVEVKANALTKCEDATIDVQARENGTFAYNSNDTRSEGYTEYTFMDDLSDGHGSVFRYEYSGGGTGRFTSLWLLEDLPSGGGNMVRISFLEGTGDRCGGYISNAEIIEGPDGDDLIVERLITPFIFLVKSDDLPLSFDTLEPYTDVADCAVCCAGTMTTRRPISDNDANSVVGFEISKTSIWLGGAVNDQGHLQGCFNDLVDEQSNGEGLLALSVDEADRFRESFARHCIGD